VKKRKKRLWLQLYSPVLGSLSYPVELVSQGTKFAKVRLLHKTHIGRMWYERGTIKHRVPVSSLSDDHGQHTLVSLGGGRFR
jgi:hypothetical protein